MKSSTNKFSKKVMNSNWNIHGADAECTCNVLQKKYLQGRIISVEIERRDPRKVYFSVVFISTNAIDPIILSTASAYSNGLNRKSGSLVLTDLKC